MLRFEDMGYKKVVLWGCYIAVLRRVFSFYHIYFLVYLDSMDGNKGNNGHGKYAVSCFTKLAVSQFLVKRNSDYEITSLKFFSDGTGQHFKQKFSICQVVTLNFPEVSQVSWHFFATSHGKGPIDGLGGTIKHRISEY